MNPYADSSFLISLYVPNDNTDDAFDIWERIGAPALPFNPMHRLEVRNGIRQMVFETDRDRRIDHHTAHLALTELERDVGRDLLHQPLVWTNLLRRAESLSAEHTERTGIRAYDLFHVAAAIEHGRGLLLTFDQRQAGTARAVGLEALGV